MEYIHANERITEWPTSRGNVVNVPADSISTVKIIRRRPEQSDTVHVKLT